MIFDHNEILEFSLMQLRNRVRQAPIGFNLLPEKFTLLQLMHLYEEILGIELDKSNFRRKILHMKLLVALDEKQKMFRTEPQNSINLIPKSIKNSLKKVSILSFKTDFKLQIPTIR